MKFMKLTLSKALDPSVMISAAKVALVVGPIITLVNQWDFLLAGHINVLKAALSFVIPYSVSIVSFLLAYSKMNRRSVETPEVERASADMLQHIKRLDALVLILEQQDNQERLSALTYKSGTSSSYKSINLLSELKHLQSAFKRLT